MSGENLELLEYLETVDFPEGLVDTENPEHQEGQASEENLDYMEYL